MGLLLKVTLSCVDAIGLDKAGCDWNISALCLDAICLAAEFFSCNFCWVKHEANMTAHTLVKFCSLQDLLLFISLKISQPL